MMRLSPLRNSRRRQRTLPCHSQSEKIRLASTNRLSMGQDVGNDKLPRPLDHLFQPLPQRSGATITAATSTLSPRVRAKAHSFRYPAAAVAIPPRLRRLPSVEDVVTTISSESHTSKASTAIKRQSPVVMELLRRNQAAPAWMESSRTEPTTAPSLRPKRATEDEGSPAKSTKRRKRDHRQDPQ